MMLIGKDDIIHHLVTVVPRVQFFVQWTVSQLRGVSVHVCKCQARHGVCERVGVEGIRHVGVMVLHAVHAIEHATNKEAVSVKTAAEACAEGPYWLKVSGTEVDEQDHFLVETLGVQGRVE